MAIYKTTSSAQTKRIAAGLAKELLRVKTKRKKALVLALSGDLGSGKTTFVQRFLRSLGIRKKITSPTFVIFKRFKIQDLRFKNGYHIDCYRIKKSKELLDLGIKEILNNPQNIVLIEWAEKIKKSLSRDTIWLRFYHGKKINQRILKIKLL